METLQKSFPGAGLQYREYENYQIVDQVSIVVGETYLAGKTNRFKSYFHSEEGEMIFHPF